MLKDLNTSPLYFAHFNTIRLIAAAMVFFHHMQQGFNSYIRKNDSFDNYDIVDRNGVLLFFVLSGFLITSLLLREKKQSQKINIKSFYIKRVLRIWPLYFLIIIFAFWIAPEIDFFYIADFKLENRFYTKIITYSFFLSNLASFLGAVPYAWHLWSIATEEQFYIIWPILLQKFQPLKLLIVSLFVYLVLRFTLLHVGSGFPILNILREWSSLFMISSMIIGGFFAYILFRGLRFKTCKLEIRIHYVIILTLIFLNIKQINFGFLNSEIYSVLVGIVIFIVASSNKIQGDVTEFKLFSYLGKISYGLYMYQPITMIIIYKLAVIFKLKSIWIIYSFSIVLLILISSLSFKYFETPFLNLKKKLK